MLRKVLGKGKEKAEQSTPKKDVREPTTEEALQERYTRIGWTDADLKAIAVLDNEKADTYRTKFRKIAEMVEPLKYIHQIKRISEKEIEYDDSKPPRDITTGDVVHAYTKGQFSMTDKSYNWWRTYCLNRNINRSTAGYQQFPDWEYDFYRSWFYLWAGEIRAQFPNQNPLSMHDSMEPPRVPLDNRVPSIEPTADDLVKESEHNPVPGAKKSIYR
ncbi:MAG: hypothetical protein L6R42_009369 [Xanthoria sp. 1 TBL-2021]|nr:MAG: hypothetical protein L6R42_009369 [Xanthoria sp. 1 TBL-2021]